MDTQLSGLILIKPQVFPDERGFFYESYRASRYREAGIDCTFVQDNVSFSKRHVIRGLHYQATPGQAKLVSVIQGVIWDVAVDIRPDSATYGQWQAFELSEKNRHQLFIPVGFAHGYCVLSEAAYVFYKVSSPFDPAQEKTLSWKDPAFQIDWPVQEPILSQKDFAQSFL